MITAQNVSCCKLNQNFLLFGTISQVTDTVQYIFYARLRSEIVRLSHRVPYHAFGALEMTTTFGLNVTFGRQFFLPFCQGSEPLGGRPSQVG